MFLAYSTAKPGESFELRDGDSELRLSELCHQFTLELLTLLVQA